jgi:hypothetical protein
VLVRVLYSSSDNHHYTNNHIHRSPRLRGVTSLSSRESAMASLLTQNLELKHYVSVLSKHESMLIKSPVYLSVCASPTKNF